MQPAGDGDDTPSRVQPACLGLTEIWLHCTVMAAISLLLLPTGIISLLGAHNFGGRSSCPLVVTSVVRFEWGSCTGRQSLMSSLKDRVHKGFFFL